MWVMTVQSLQCPLKSQRLEHRWSKCPWKYWLDYNISMIDSRCNPSVSHGRGSANNIRRMNGLFCTWNHQPVGCFICTIKTPTALCIASHIFSLCLQLWLKQLLMHICFVIFVLQFCSPLNITYVLFLIFRLFRNKFTIICLPLMNS